MPDQQFDDKLEISSPFVAKGIIDRDYDVSRMYVGVVQYDRDKDNLINVTGAAYGMGDGYIEPNGAKPNTSGTKMGWKEVLKGSWWIPSSHACRQFQVGHDDVYNGAETGTRCCKDAL